MKINLILLSIFLTSVFFVIYFYDRYDQLVLSNYLYKVSCSEFPDTSQTLIDSCNEEIEKITDIDIQFSNIDQKNCHNKVGVEINILSDEMAKKIISKFPSGKLQCGIPYRIINV